MCALSRKNSLSVSGPSPIAAGLDHHYEAGINDCSGLRQKLAGSQSFFGITWRCV